MAEDLPSLSSCNRTDKLLSGQARSADDPIVPGTGRSPRHAGAEGSERSVMMNDQRAPRKLPLWVAWGAFVVVGGLVIVFAPNDRIVGVFVLLLGVGGLIMNRLN
jgi:hypothetical protein